MDLTATHQLSATVARMAVRTPTLPPATHTNMYALGTRDVVLVEPASPYADEIDRAAEWADSLRRAGRTIRAILITHHHADHVGGAVALRERLGVPLWAHARTAERAARVPVERLLEDGDAIDLDGPVPTRVTCVLTPGHAPGHLCFGDSHSGMLLAGDMVASVGTILIEPRDGDMAQYLASLERLRELNATALLPAHGDVISDADGKLTHYIAHRIARETKILQALQDHGRVATIEELLPIAYADADPSAWPLASLSTAAHLIKLDSEGLVERRPGGWRAI